MKDAAHWDDFRARREIEIDKYLAQKKKQRALEQLIAMSKLSPLFKNSWRVYQWLKAKRRREQQVLMIQVFCLARFKFKTKQNRGIDNIMRNRVRGSFMLATLMEKRRVHKRLKFVLEEFLEYDYFLKNFTQHALRYINGVVALQ